MSEFRLKHGARTDLPSSLPEGDHFLVTSDGTNAVSPPEFFTGPEGGGTPEQVSPPYNESSVSITGGTIEGVNLIDSVIKDFDSAGVSDDTAISNTILDGLIVVIARGTSNEGTDVGLFLATEDGNTLAPAASLIEVADVNNSMTAQTGTLTGTDGSDASINVSVTQDQVGTGSLNIYVENRIGHEVNILVATV